MPSDQSLIAALQLIKSFSGKTLMSDGFDDPEYAQGFEAGALEAFEQLASIANDALALIQTIKEV